MRVLFTHSYFLAFDIKQLNTHTPYPPLATLYAAAVLREKGYDVKLSDLQFSTSAYDIEKSLTEFQPDLFVIYDDGFNYLTKMCLTNMREAAFIMLHLAKAKGIVTAVSSSDASDHLKNYFDEGADYIIIGEAEQTLLELTEGLKSKSGDLSAITGLVYKEKERMIRNPPRLVMKELDALPLPAWDLVEITPYKKSWLKHHGYFSLNMVTTRGCPYKCNWCAKPIYGNRYNSHSPLNIAKQIKDLQLKFGFTHIWFADDIFGLKPKWLQDFNTAVQQLQLKVSYKIQSRADLLLEEKNIQYLAESGCKEVWMGAESGSQKILDAMDKGTTIEQIKEATLLLKKHGIKACFFLQFGYSGEYMEDIQATLHLLTELQPDDIGISVSYPLPGTGFYDQVKSDLLKKQNWKDSDDLDLMFKGTYSSAFYKTLQRFVHYHFRSLQASKLVRQGRINRRAVLGPYYYLRRNTLKQQLLSLEPDAKSLF